MLFRFAAPSEQLDILLIDYFEGRLWQLHEWMHFSALLKAGEPIFVILPLQVPRHFQIQEEEEQVPLLEHVAGK